ncbi:uncharacterized protein LOC134852140 [Symsagittifera roscoffensis]|uniref:uncharacterized protein LOC134852140 n=1 Tax=Symsagittifera roscoffensis TaxID=84072 RepID=UPI00307C6FFE
MKMTVELLALLLVSGVAFVSAGVTDNQAEQWSEVDGSESVCKTDLEKLSQASSSFGTWLSQKQCPATNIQCVEKFQNPFIDEGYFEVDGGFPENAKLYVYQIICYKSTGVTTNEEGEASFVMFVSTGDDQGVPADMTDKTKNFFKIEADIDYQSFKAYMNNFPVLNGQIGVVMALLISGIARHFM